MKRLAPLILTLPLLACGQCAISTGTINQQLTSTVDPTLPLVVFALILITAILGIVATLKEH